MQKKSKTILTAVVTALFVLSVGYFALLAPTTAWFYQKDDKAYSFTFGNFNMSEELDEDELEIADITLRGTTRFADAGETLFDEMLHVIKVKATNTGEAAGSIRVKVFQNGTELHVNDDSDSDTCGLKWFVYAPDSTATPAVTAKSSINTMLRLWNSEWPINYNTLTHGDVNGSDTAYTNYNPVNGQAETAYEAYNVKAIEALKAFNEGGVTVQPGETDKDIYVVFWAEYGDLKDTFEVGESAADRTISTVTYSDLAIKIIAAPDIGGTQTTTLTISNTSSDTVSLKLYRWTSAWSLYTDSTTAANGSFDVASGSTKQITGLPVGMRFKLEFDGAPTAYFNASDALKAIDDAGTMITGTLTNETANTVTLQSTPGLYVINRTSAAASVKVYTWVINSKAWVESPISPLNIAAGAQSQLPFSLDTQYKLELTTASTHFNDSGMSTQVMGRVTSGSNTHTIVPDTNS